MTKEDIGEMRMAAAAAVGLFPRIEIDPAHVVELCTLAAEALAIRAEQERIASILGDPAGGVSVPVSLADMETMLIDKLRTR